MQKLTGLNDKPQDLDGQPIDVTAGRLIANCILGSNSTDAIRAYEVALKIHKAKMSVELEDEDFKMAKQAVEGSGLPVLTKHVALRCFRETT